MQNLLRKWVLAVLLTALLSSSAWAQGRLATIDLKKVFESYWKTKQASATLDDRKKDMEKEDKNMLDDYKTKKDDYQSSLTAASDQNVSSGERDKRKKAAEDKLKQLKDLEDTIVQYERQARTTLVEQNQRMRNNILGEIRNVVTAKAKAGSFSLVIDTAAQSADATPIVLFTNNENDITAAVLDELNRTAPTDTPKADDKPAVTLDDKNRAIKK
ncbi:MAG TPA: OmpH family outer membrane protein [Candidatus Acidoferrum sp.]|jgi:outer membrane protein|nr:OmpH family outer membrane protein [Candidatus Acidoferrum sp.]